MERLCCAHTYRCWPGVPKGCLAWMLLFFLQKLTSLWLSFAAAVLGVSSLQGPCFWQF